MGKKNRKNKNSEASQTREKVTQEEQKNIDEVFGEGEPKAQQQELEPPLLNTDTVNEEEEKKRKLFEELESQYVGETQNTTQSQDLLSFDQPLDSTIEEQPQFTNDKNLPDQSPEVVQTIDQQPIVDLLQVQDGQKQDENKSQIAEGGGKLDTDAKQQEVDQTELKDLIDVQEPQPIQESIKKQEEREDQRHSADNQDLLDMTGLTDRSNIMEAEPFTPEYVPEQQTNQLFSESTEDITNDVSVQKEEMVIDAGKIETTQEVQQEIMQKNEDFSHNKRQSSNPFLSDIQLKPTEGVNDAKQPVIEAVMEDVPLTQPPRKKKKRQQPQQPAASQQQSSMDQNGKDSSGGGWGSSLWNAVPSAPVSNPLSGLGSYTTAVSESLKKNVEQVQAEYQKNLEIKQQKMAEDQKAKEKQDKLDAKKKAKQDKLLADKQQKEKVDLAKKEMEELESKQKAILSQELKPLKQTSEAKPPKDDESIPKRQSSIPENPLAAIAKKPDSKKIGIEENVKSEHGSNISKSSKPKKQSSLAGSSQQKAPKAAKEEPRPSIGKLSVPDNSDVTSQVSFNTSFFQDQFDNMDSISQVMGNDDRISDSGQSIAGEMAKRDKKIADLLSDRTKLKNLLKKAKVAIDSINAKYKGADEGKRSAEQTMLNALEKNKDLVKTLEIIQNQRSGIDKADVKAVLCRLRCDDVNYTLIQRKDMESVWYQDSMIINIQEQCNAQWKEVKQVNFNTVFKEKKQMEDNLTQCMAQYEERLKRVNEYMESSNSSYLKCQEELQQCRQKYTKEMQERDNALSLLIEKSIDLKSTVISIDEKVNNQFNNKSGRKVKTNIGDNIQDLEASVSRMMNMRGLENCHDQNIIDIKNHLIDLYQKTSLHLLKKHQSYCEKIHLQDKEWQETCDQLISEHQALKDERDRNEGEMSEKITKMSEQLQRLNTEHYTVVKANEENTEKLKVELENSLNAHYLKNILTSYFSTNDTTVQINLIKVVFKVMNYTQDEQEKVMTAWNQNNQSMAQRVWSFGGM